MSLCDILKASKRSNLAFSIQGDLKVVGKNQIILSVGTAFYMGVIESKVLYKAPKNIIYARRSRVETK